MKVSVIIPCYNVADYVEECLHSVFAQSWSDLEVIVVDNASTDDTLSRLQKFRQAYPNLILLEEPKKGASVARNTGLQHARGEWVQFLDADDLLLPEKLEHQMALLAEHQNNPAFLAGASRKRLVDGKEVASPLSDLPPLIALFVGSGGLGNTCANLWNRTAIRAVGGWDEHQKSSQETELMFRLLQAGGQVLRDQKSYTLIRERASGRISDRSIESRMRFLELRFQMLEYLREKELELYRTYYHRMYSKLFDVCLFLARQDVVAAMDVYRQLPVDFRPLQLQKRLYKWLIDRVGFERVERIRKQLMRK